MDENKNNGELFGFDSAENSEPKNDGANTPDITQSNEAASEDNTSRKGEEGGYTVTPLGSFFEEFMNDESDEDTESNDDSAQSGDTEEDDFSIFMPQSHNDSDNGAFVFREETSRPRRPKREKSKGSFSLKTVIAAVLIAAIVGTAGGIGGSLIYSKFLSNGASSGPQINVTSPGGVNIDVSNVETTVVEAVATKVTPSVVGIRTTVSSYNFLYGEQESSGEGSGVIYSADGYIITNYHVIQDAIDNRGNSSKIRVFLTYGDEEGYEAAIVGYNISYDLAVLKINASGLEPVKFADSEALRVGQFVVAIGNPGGLQFMSSVTYGVVSGLNRIVSDTGVGSGGKLIQTDAAINPGNSGGALVNLQGELVGINSSKLVSESYEGMGFAIPSNTTKDICDKIISKENDPDPFLGVTINTSYTAEILKQNGYPAGAVVYSVVSGSPADEAGIREYDIITELNGVTINDYSALGDALANCKPGQQITLKVFRRGNSYTLNVTLGSNNSQ